MNKIPTLAATAFFNRVCSVMGAYVETSESVLGVISRMWSVDTDCGKLSVEVYEDQGYQFSVFMRFAGDHSMALARLGANAVNPHSGKWNILLPSADLAIAELGRRLASVGGRVLAAVG